MSHSNTGATASLQRLFNLSVDPMCVVGEGGRMERLNNALGQTLGQTTSDLVGTRFIDNVFAEDRDRVEGMLSSLAQDGKTPTSFDARLSGREGSPVWIEWRAEGDDLGDTLCLVGKDVSSRKVTEQALHREEDFVTLLQIAAVAANEASSLEEALEIVIAAVCVRRKLPLGHAYLVAEPGVLASSRIWHMQEAQRFTPLIEASEGRTYLSGVGVPGTVLKRDNLYGLTSLPTPTFYAEKRPKAVESEQLLLFPSHSAPRCSESWNSSPPARLSRTRGSWR